MLKFPAYFPYSKLIIYMRKFLTLIFILTIYHVTVAQAPKANYQQASRYSSRKLGKMIFSTSVDPHWLKQSDRFWYVYETPAGKKWYIVDPSKPEKRVMFDNAKLAAELSRIVKD